MKCYGEWAPTGFDTKGLALAEQRDWLVAPVLWHHKLDGVIDRANYLAIKEELSRIDPDCETWEAHLFGHWASDFHIIIVKPDTPAAVFCQQVETALAGYPVVSDEVFSRVEDEERQAYWGACSADEKRELCRKAHIHHNKARCKCYPHDVAEHMNLVY